MRLNDAIKTLIEKKGIEIIRDERFTNFLDDFNAFSEKTANKSIVNQFHKSIFMDKLYQLLQQKINDQIKDTVLKEEINKIKNQFVTSTGISQFLADDVIDKITCGLGLIEEQSPLFEHYLGQWNMTYDNEKGLHMIIDIKPNYKVETSSSSQYLWKILSNGSINIYIPDIVNYIGKIDGNTIWGRATNLTSYKQWAWHAHKANNALTETKLLKDKWILHNEAELEDDIVTFEAGGTLISQNYNKGNWTLDKYEISVITANGFITYKGRFADNANAIYGTARNKIGKTWNFNLQQKK